MYSTGWRKDEPLMIIHESSEDGCKTDYSPILADGSGVLETAGADNMTLIVDVRDTKSARL